MSRPSSLNRRDFPKAGLLTSEHRGAAVSARPGVGPGAAPPPTPTLTTVTAAAAWWVTST